MSDPIPGPKKKRAPRKKKVAMPAEAWKISLTENRIPFSRSQSEGTKTYWFEHEPVEKIAIGTPDAWSTAGTQRITFSRTEDGTHDIYLTTEDETRRLLVTYEAAKRYGLPSLGIKQVQYHTNYGIFPVFNDQLLKSRDLVGDVNLTNYRESIIEIRKALESRAFAMYNPTFCITKSGHLKLMFLSNFYREGVDLSKGDFEYYHRDHMDLLKRFEAFAAYAADPANKDRNLRYPFDDAHNWMKTEGERRLRSEAANMEIVTEDWVWEAIPLSRV